MISYQPFSTLNYYIKTSVLHFILNVMILLTIFLSFFVTFRLHSIIYIFLTGLYQNVAKKVATQESNYNNNNSKTNNNKNSSNARIGKIFIDPSAAPYQTVRGSRGIDENFPYSSISTIFIIIICF